MNSHDRHFLSTNQNPCRCNRKSVPYHDTVHTYVYKYALLLPLRGLLRLRKMSDHDVSTFWIGNYLEVIISV